MSYGEKPSADTILMVAPIPAEGSYIGGIGTSIRRLIDRWDLPTPVVHFNPELFKRAYGTTGQLNWRNFSLAVINFVRLFCCIIKVRPTVVHYHTSRGNAFLKDMVFAGLLRRLFCVKTILHIRSSDSAKILMGHRRSLHRVQLRVLQHCCHRLVLLSDNVVSDFAQVLGQNAGNRLRSRCTVLPNFTIFPDVCRKHEPAHDHLRLFYIGNISREKGICDTIEAARRLRRELAVPFKVVFAGPFNDRREELQIRALVADCHLSETVVFLGTVYDSMKEAAFLQSDIFVLPSYSEGMPQSMLEAMAYGLPVVVSSVGGIPEVVRDGQEGRIIKPGDVEGLCRALQELMESVECRQRMGAAARDRIAAHYTINNYMGKLQDLYDSMLTPAASSQGHKRIVQDSNP